MADIDASAFNDDLAERLRALGDNLDVNRMVEGLNECIKATLDLHAPKKVKRVKRDSQVKWINGEILALMKHRDYLKRHGHEAEYKRVRNQVNQAMNYYGNAIQMAKGDSRKLWKTIKDASDKIKLL